MLVERNTYNGRVWQFEMGTYGRDVPYYVTFVDDERGRQWVSFHRNLDRAARSLGSECPWERGELNLTFLTLRRAVEKCIESGWSSMRGKGGFTRTQRGVTYRTACNLEFKIDRETILDLISTEE